MLKVKASTAALWGACQFHVKFHVITQANTIYDSEF